MTIIIPYIDKICIYIIPVSVTNFAILFFQFHHGMLEWQNFIIFIFPFEIDILALEKILIMNLVTVHPCKQSVFHLWVSLSHAFLKSSKRNALFEIFQVITFIHEKIGVI